MRKRLAWGLGLPIAGLLMLGAAVLVSGCGAFGRHADGERLARMRQSPEWRDDHFNNTQTVLKDFSGAMLRALASVPDTEPSVPVPVHAGDAAQYATAPADGLRVTWFGHSSTLVEIDGVRVLTDPIWSERASPVQWIGPHRWFAPPLPLEQLPAVDVVVISHDHYDHLDRATIVAMKQWHNVFVVPLGIGAHLEHWGIPPQRIIELDWWQSARVGTLEVTATPSRHASGRLKPESDTTLWSGFALRGPAHRVWYSGDTGFFAGMREIGERLGPFDLTMIESGQYDAAWPDWHLGPEQALAAHRLVRGKVMLPVHWGLFKLAPHGWTEPGERALAAADCAGVRLLLPQPGLAVQPLSAQAAEPRRWWPQARWLSAAQTPVVATVAGDAAVRMPPSTCLAAAGTSSAAAD
jgi:L-ascorbate metabolism protein UlaG (beta-lactamase superfamily)